MEPLDSDCLTSQTDVVNVEKVDYRSPSPITSCAGSDCSISRSATKAIAAAEAAVEERNHVMLRLMSHLIPVSTGPEDGSASETDNSIVSSASTLKCHLHNLPPPSEAVKLADRVAVLNRRIRKERDLYLHLQGLTNRIEEKDEGDLGTTDSSKTMNSTSNRQHQGLINNARARRRERLNSGSATSHHQISSDLKLCSPGLSSPERLTLKEIRENSIEEMDQLSPPIEDQYCFENDPITNLMRENIANGMSISSITQEFKIADEVIGSRQNASKFFSESYTDRKVCPVVSSCQNSTAMIDAPLEGHAEFFNVDFHNGNYFKDGFTNCSLSLESENARVRATTSSTASSTGVDYPYMTRKRAPMKFGGYRPASGLIFRNLSSDSESDATSDRIIHKELRSQKYRLGSRTDFENHNTEDQELQDSDFISRNFGPNKNRITEREPFSVEKMEVLKDRLFSPVVLAESRHFEDSNPNQKIETYSELEISEEINRASIPSNGRNRQLDGDTRNAGEQNFGMNVDTGILHDPRFIEESFKDSFGKEKDAQYVHHISFPEAKPEDILSELPSNKQCVNLSVAKSSAEVSEITNHQTVPALVRSLTESMSNPENLRNQAYEHSFFHQEFVAVDSSAHTQSRDDPADNNVHPEIPPLEIEAQDYSQSHSLSSEDREDETGGSSLDVNALIQALSDVSLKQKNATDCTNRSMMKLKSPLGYGNRFSGSSGPRSSEYTPAAGGSRQSLTSLEVSESHSLKISKGELTARRQAPPLLKYNEQSARLASKIADVFNDLPRHAPNIKKSPVGRSKPLEDVPIQVDLSQGNSFIPVVAKINRTNLVCPEHPLRIKSISKLISPRKYQSTDFNGEIANSLTARTDVSQSSKGSRRSFLSLKLDQLDSKEHRKKIKDLKPKTESTNFPVPLSGRRVLEPLNSVPKIQPDLPISMNRRSDRRQKIAKDLSEIINNQSEDGSERTTTPISSKNSYRRSPLSRINRTDSPIPRLSQRLKSPTVRPKGSAIHETKVSSSRRTPGEPFDNSSRSLIGKNHKLLQNSIKGKKYSGMSSDKSSMISGNVLCLRSKRLSMSSGDYEGEMSCSPSPIDENLTENDNTYGLEDKLYDQQQPVGTNCKRMSEVMDLDAQDMRLSNLTTSLLDSSSRNCVHLNDLQDGREVTLPCGNTRCLRDKELFNRLPNEISGSLTRHTSFDTHVAKNLRSTKEIPSTIEDLRRNIQENNDRWIRGFKSDDDSGNVLPESADDIVSSTESSVRYRKSESQNLLSNLTRIPRKVPHADPGRFNNGCSSPLYGDVRQESEYNSDSQRSSLLQSSTNSHQNTYRSLVESTDSTTVHKSDETLEHEVSTRNFARSMTEASAIQSCNLREEQIVNSERQNVRLCDIQVISNTTKEIITRKDSPKAPFSVHPSDSTSDTDEHDQKALNRSIDTKSNSADDVEASETIPSKITKFKNWIIYADPNSECDSTSNRPLEYSQSKLKNLGYSDKDCGNSEEKMIVLGCDQESRFVNKLADPESSMYPARCSDTEYVVCGKSSSPNSPRSAKSPTQHHQEGIISSPVSLKTFLSMSKLTSSADSKWDMTVVMGANNVKKSQDRFPFTISESASRKTSKFKVVADVSIDQLIQDQNAHAKNNDAVLTQQPILEKSGDQQKVSTHTVNTEKKLDSCKQSPIRQLTPFSEELTRKISNDSPDNWGAQVPFIGLNYMSYGSREESRTLMPAVKEMVKKLSTKLRYARAKRCQNLEETMVKILYMNKKCRCESGEGSSSAASLNQSQFLNISNKPIPSSVRRSNDGSRASSGKTTKPKRNHECTSMSLKNTPRKGCDQNDLWIQEFDSDVEFDTQLSTIPYWKMPNELETETMPRTSSPVNDRYSMFLARRKLSGVINEADHNEQSTMCSVSNCCDGGDNAKVTCKRLSDVDGPFVELPEMVLKSPKTPANSSNDNIQQFEIDGADGNCEDSTTKSGCCCFRIYHFFVKSKKRSSKTPRRTRVWKNK